MAAKLVRWLIFGVLASLLPLVFSYVHLATDDKNPSLALVVSHGELLLISFVLAADAVGELIAAGGNEMRAAKLLAGGGCVLAAGFAALYFADVSSKETTKLEIVSQTSLTVFAFTVIASASCKILAEEIS